MNIPDQIKWVEDELGGKCDKRSAVSLKAVLETLKNCQYYEAIPKGGMRIEIRGLRDDGQRRAVVRIAPPQLNDTLIISLAREVALEFWKVFSK